MTTHILPQRNLESVEPRDVGALVAIPNRTRASLQVHLRIASCRNLLMREARRSVERWGLTLPQFDVLAELERERKRGFTFGELSQLLLVTSGNLTGIVDRLEADGFARRKHDKSDRRVVRIVLTPKGLRLIKQILPLHAQDIQSSLNFMTAQRLNKLLQLLGEVRDGLRDRAPGDERARQAGRQPKSRTSARMRGRLRLRPAVQSYPGGQAFQGPDGDGKNHSLG
jgi:DNA-binding MarR family transcriptional regulator